MESVLNGMPWWAVLILMLALIFLVMYLIHKQVSIKVGKLSIETEKKIIKQNQDNSVRLKIHAQIREYENYTGKIERNIYSAFEKTYSNLTHDEKIIVKLFCNLIRRGLEKQLMLDLVANHIVNKTPEQLREYTANKTQGYQNRILNFLSNYNETILPEHNILEIISNVDLKELEDIYYSIYTKAVQIARQE